MQLFSLDDTPIKEEILIKRNCWKARNLFENDLDHFICICVLHVPKGLWPNCEVTLF